MSLDDPTRRELVARASWHVQLWLVDADYTLHDQAPTTTPDEHTSIRVPPYDTEECIATMEQFPPKAAAMLTDLTEARPLILNELTMKALQVDNSFLDLSTALRLLTSCHKTS
jgi:hypothetical protein